MIINNKIAVVTGGASGMGYALAELLHQHGAQVVTWDVRPKPTAWVSLECDVRSEESVQAAIASTIEQRGIPSICINCAGIAPATKLIGKQGVHPLDLFENVIDINLVGTFNVMRLVVATMLENQITENEPERGVIINTASVAAYEGQIGQLAYSASKGGIVAMTLPAARELAQHKIRVNTIAPGMIATPLFQGLPVNVQEALAAAVPFPKRLGRPEEFAKLALHIIDNEYLNGEVIRLDGAIRMQAK